MNDTAEPVTGSSSPEETRLSPSSSNALLAGAWKDITSFSKEAKDRTPRTWEASFGQFRLVLTRHRDFPPDVWVAKCYGVFDLRQMETKDVRKAADQAKGILRSALNEALRDIIQG